ncbi:Adenosine deaminase related growth factor [Operophtera brumata]|uniref:Adenosine deaminase n=1 Tax=Operophtera brumata TaxID=104452 RepID=A0A0L7LUI0_OPEBR|nr:Adenosine deaminase related growth factor [Operophtera brumata]
MCDITEYHARRTKLTEAETSLALGGNTTLDPQEIIVNKCLMQHKFQELNYAFDHPKHFNFSHHFFTYKKKMRDSKVYKIIKDMPKGAALHIHDLALQGPDYLMNITYKDNLYICCEPYLRFKFANQPPNRHQDSNWRSINNARRDAKNVTKFDADLRKRFTLVVDDPDTAYPSITETWAALGNYFKMIRQLLSFRPVFEQYIYDTLKKFREDNIMYMEVRTALINLYELDGTTHDTIETAKSCLKILNRFKKDYPDFEGVKLIYARSKSKSLNDDLDSYVRAARSIKQHVPEIFAGFDLVGQEDTSLPLIEVAAKLLEVNDLNFFFHAGETGWSGTASDGNLYDAILLGSKRIGHAYALIKHPQLMKEVVARDIGLEINLISNSVLSLVKDMRNHPLNAYIANGMPVVLSSDDPGAWEAEPLSDDFYVAFLGASSRLSNFGMLKALGENSLKYSALSTFFATGEGCCFE